MTGLFISLKNVFLHDHLSETVYMYQPSRFVDPARPDYLCHLQKSLYGLKQAPRAWFQHFASFATRTGFQQNLGSLNYILGISAQRTASGLFLSQSKFAEEILEGAHMQHCNPYRTPVDTESKLGPDGDPVSDSTLYRSLAGALQYLTFTRPDISYVVQQICLYMYDPREPHLAALNRIIRYVRGTLDHGLQLHVSTTTQLTAYIDADWAGCQVTRQSTSGYCVFLGDNLLSWSAKRQVIVFRSSAEAEYRGVANVVAETGWICYLLLELHAPLHNVTLVYGDNVSVVYLSTNLVQHQRTKHIEIDIHFVRDYVASGQVRVLHVPSRFQYADIFTKSLPSALFFEFRSRLMDLADLQSKGFRGLADLQNGKVKKSVTFKILEGVLLELYKTIVVHVHVETNGLSNVVTWTTEYEKLNPDVPAPGTLMEFRKNLTKDIETQHFNV
ncbi:ribonuclease H-like domain-containing protein [Tanacetum coccineum]